MANADIFRALAKGLADRILLIFNQMKNESLTTSLLMLTIDDTETGVTPPAFNLPAYWEKLHYACEKVAHEIDKLCIAYSKDTTPNITEPEYRALLVSMEASFSFLVTHFYTLPKSQGRTMYDMVHETVFSVVEAVMKFVSDMEEQAAASVALAYKVHSATKGVKKSPPDNLKAAIKALADEEGLVADALSEIEEELKNFPGEDDDGDEEDSWSDADTALIYPCVGIVKTARFCVKKLSEVVNLRGSCGSLAEIEQLDRLVAAGRTLSPAVDDLVSSLYPPLAPSDVHFGARSLTDLVQAMLGTASKGHYVVPSDAIWIEVLRKTAEHNWKKLDT